MRVVHTKGMLINVHSFMKGTKLYFFVSRYDNDYEVFEKYREDSSILLNPSLIKNKHSDSKYLIGK